MDLALPLLIVRLIGLGFAAHGAQKLFGWFGGYGLAGTGGFFEQVGFRPGRFFAATASVSEIVAGLLMVLGLGGPLGPMLVVATMVVAILAIHWSNGFFAGKNGVEVPLLWLVIGFALAFTGYGAYSLDAVFALSALSTPAIAWIAVGLGIAGGLVNVALRRKPAPSEAQPAA